MWYYLFMAVITPTVTPTISPEIADKLTGTAYVDTILTSLFSVDFMMIIKLLVAWLVIAWLLTVIWVFKDAYNRYNSLYMPTFWALLVLPFNLLGLFAYIILRPSDYFIDKEQEEYDIKLLEGEALEYIDCPVCGAINNRKGEYCTECGTHLTGVCPKCGNKVWADWQFCKFCGQALDVTNFDFEYDTKKEKVTTKSLSNATVIKGSILNKEETLKTKDIKKAAKFTANINKSLISVLLDFSRKCVLWYQLCINNLRNLVSKVFKGLAHSIKAIIRFIWEVIVETANLIWAILKAPFVFTIWIFKSLAGFINKWLGAGLQDKDSRPKNKNVQKSKRRNKGSKYKRVRNNQRAKKSRKYVSRKGRENNKKNKMSI